MTKASSSTPPTTSSNATSKGPTSFQFVTFSNVDHMRDSTAISSIRRHAMKDIGRQRRKPKKKRFIEIPIDIPLDFNVPHPVPAIGGGGAHTFFPIPVELDHVGKGLLANIWRETGDCLFNAHREDWFSVGLGDAATFNQILANSALHLEATKTRDKLPRETETSVRYHQMAVSSIRQRIGLGEVSMQVVGCITALLVYTEIAGAFDRWLPQRNGLLSIIESLEGGLESVENNQQLRSATSWVELRGAFRQDIRPALELPKRWLQIAEQHNRPSEYCRGYPDGVFGNDMRCPLVHIFRDLSHLGSLVNTYLQNHDRDETRGNEILTWTNVTAHRLLTLRPLQSDCDLFNPNVKLMLESWRLAMLTVIGMIYEAFGAHPLSSAPYVQEQHRLLSKNTIDWDGFVKTKLWIVYVAALQAGEDTAKRRWFVMELVTSAADVGNETYEELEQRVRGVLWIPALFESNTEAMKRDTERTCKM